MGEEEFTPEERVILGEIEPEPSTEVQEPPAEAAPAADAAPAPSEQPEHTDDEKAAAEKMGFRIEGKFIVDSEGSKIPLKRFRELYFTAKEADRGKAETQQKLNLFKELGPDKFYELYPDEKPAGYKPATPRAERDVPANIGAMVVQGGAYDGQTLNEVYQIDPAYATLLQNQYLDAQREKTTSAAREKEDAKKAANDEITAFSDQVASEMAGKKYAELTREEEARVNETIQTTIDWMAKTRRGAGIIADAYFLMNREKIIADAQTKGGKAALASLSKPPIASVDTGGGKAAVGMDAFEAMTGEQIAAKVAGMSDQAMLKFLKEAPASVRAKNPTLPWD